jgi:hypothetical protein
MSDDEFSYFAPDRLVGVLRIEDPDEPVLSAHLYALIHLTSRFGAFIREGGKWELMWQGWNPDPDLKYMNFSAESYDMVVRAFDQNPDDFLYYDDMSGYQEILNWEGGYDDTESPECLRDIAELVNWIQDFVDSKLEVITYGSTRISISDMDWMRHDVAELEYLQAETEEYVLRQRRKPASEVIEEKLYRIHMHPRLHDAVVEAFNEAGNHAASADCLDEFDAEMQGTAVQNYLNGGKASIRELNAYLLDLISIGIDYQTPVNRESIERYRLTRDLHLKPANRLEAWFPQSPKEVLYQLVANTKFGLFTRAGKSSWRPLKRDRDVEDVYDLAGVSIVHLRPEREQEVISGYDSGALQGIHIKDPALNKFQLDYRGDVPSGSDFYARVDGMDKKTIKYSQLQRVAAVVIREMTAELRGNIKVLQEADFDLGFMPANLTILDAFVKNEKELSYPQIHQLLTESFSENEDGESIQRSAADVAEANQIRMKFEKLIDRRNIEYLPTASMFLVVAYEPITTMWLEYRSQNYGTFARVDVGWKSGFSQDINLYKELFLYEVKEECVNDFISIYDSRSQGQDVTSFERLAPMLCIYTMNKNQDLSEHNPRDWDFEPFTREQMPPSAAAVVEYLYMSVMKFISDFSDLLEDDDVDGHMQVDEWLSWIWSDHMIDFMNGESTLNRNLLGRFLKAAPKILQNPRNVIRENS